MMREKKITSPGIYIPIKGLNGRKIILIPHSLKEKKCFPDSGGHFSIKGLKKILPLKI